MSQPPDIRVFVATRLDDVPAECTHYASVDGTVPGCAVAWDHHVSGELVNLDAMPAIVEPGDFDGVGTTLADSDAVTSAAVFLLGGKDRLDSHVVDLLEAASHWCDHLRPHPRHSDPVNQDGKSLHDALSAKLAVGPEEVSTAFAEATWRLTSDILEGAELLSEHTHVGLDVVPPVVEDRWVSIVDVRDLGPADPLLVYAYVASPVAVFVGRHPKDGGLRYTIGVNPNRADAPTDISAALVALARAEYAHGPPCLGPEPVAGAENWGGRMTVFGSPWNYGSRLAPEQVQELVRDALFEGVS